MLIRTQTAVQKKTLIGAAINAAWVATTTQIIVAFSVPRLPIWFQWHFPFRAGASGYGGSRGRTESRHGGCVRKKGNLENKKKTDVAPDEHGRVVTSCLTTDVSSPYPTFLWRSVAPPTQEKKKTATAISPFWNSPGKFLEPLNSRWRRAFKSAHLFPSRLGDSAPAFKQRTNSVSLFSLCTGAFSYWGFNRAAATTLGFYIRINQ